MRRVDRVAAQLGLPSEDLVHAMREHAVFKTGPDAGRVAALSVRCSGGRTWTNGTDTALDRVARELVVAPSALRDAMRLVAHREGRESGSVWTMSVRVW